MPCGAMLWKLVFSGGIAASEQRHKRRTARLKLFPNLLLYQFISKLFVSHSTLCHLLMTQRSWENLDSNPAGKPSKSTDFHADFWGNSRGNFYVDIIRLLSLLNPRGYIRVEISLVLPSQFSKCNSMTSEGSLF